MRIKLDIREDGLIISTIKVKYGPYETAVLFESGNIRTCEEYKTEEEALKGHDKYLNMSYDKLDRFDFIR